MCAERLAILLLSFHYRLHFLYLHHNRHHHPLWRHFHSLWPSRTTWAAMDALRWPETTRPGRAPRVALYHLHSDQAYLWTWVCTAASRSSVLEHSYQTSASIVTLTSLMAIQLIVTVIVILIVIVIVILIVIIVVVVIIIIIIIVSNQKGKNYLDASVHGGYLLRYFQSYATFARTFFHF